MNISEPSAERIERAGNAIACKIDDIDKCGEAMFAKCGTDGDVCYCRMKARAALLADAPALIEAQIVGMREAAAIIRGNVILYQGDETKLRPRPDGEVSNLAYADAIDARIASLKTDAKPLDTDNSPP